jgi:hypothetical protein
MNVNCALTLAAVAGALGCGSSEVPQQHPAPDVGVVEIDAAPAPKSIRTLKNVPLFGGTAIENLLIDPTFEPGDTGIGRWFSSMGTGLSLDGPALSQLVLSDAPLGLSLPIGSVMHATRTFSLVAQVPGGSGPYVVSLWLSTDKPLDGDLTVVRVALANAVGTGLTGTEIVADEERTLAGRVWHHYRGEVAGPFTMGAYMTIRFRASKNRWFLQAPEVVPKKLITGDPKMLLGKPFALDADERAAVAAYQRIPRIQGVPTSASKAPR